MAFFFPFSLSLSLSVSLSFLAILRNLLLLLLLFVLCLLSHLGFTSHWPNQSATLASQSLLYDHASFHANFTNRNAQSTQHIQHAHVCLCNAAQYVGYTPLGLRPHSDFKLNWTDQTKLTMIMINRIFKEKKMTKENKTKKNTNKQAK